MVELVVVMTIIAIMAGFGIPSFTKAINRARARDAILNLNVIHASNVVYRARAGADLTAADAAAINTALGLNIIPNSAAYVCNGTVCTATGTGFVVTATLASALSSGINPACAGANCP